MKKLIPTDVREVMCGQKWGCGSGMCEVCCRPYVMREVKYGQKWGMWQWNVWSVLQTLCCEGGEVWSEVGMWQWNVWSVLQTLCCEGGEVWSEVGDVAVECVKCAADLVFYEKLTQIARRPIKSYKTWHSILQRNLRCLDAVGNGRKILPFSTETIPALLPTHLHTTG